MSMNTVLNMDILAQKKNSDTLHHGLFTDSVCREEFVYIFIRQSMTRL